jgi:hypothetical protein
VQQRSVQITHIDRQTTHARGHLEVATVGAHDTVAQGVVLTMNSMSSSLMPMAPIFAPRYPVIAMPKARVAPLEQALADHLVALSMVDVGPDAQPRSRFEVAARLGRERGLA